MKRLRVKPTRRLLARHAGQADPGARGFWRGLVLAATMTEAGGDVVDLVSGRRGVVSSAASWRPGRDGPHVGSPAGTGTHTVNFGPSAFLPTAETTVVCVHRRDPNVSLAQSGGFGVSAGQRFGAHFPFNDGVVYWDFGGGRITYSPPDFHDAVWAFTAGSFGMEMYRNGLLVSSTGTAASRTNDTDDFRLGFHAGFSADAAQFSIFLVYNRRLSAVEIQQLSIDPFAPFRKTRPRTAILGNPSGTPPAPASGGAALYHPLIQGASWFHKRFMAPLSNYWDRMAQPAVTGGGAEEHNATAESGIAPVEQSAALDSVTGTASTSALAGIAQDASLDATTRATAQSALAGVGNDAALDSTSRLNGTSALAGIGQDASLDSVASVTAVSGLSGIAQDSSLDSTTSVNGTSQVAPFEQAAIVGSEQHLVTAESSLAGIAQDAALDGVSSLNTTSALAAFEQSAVLDVEGAGTPVEEPPAPVTGPSGQGGVRDGRSARILEAEEEVNVRIESELAAFDSEAQVVVSPRPSATTSAQEERLPSTRQQEAAASGPRPSLTVAEEIEQLLASLPDLDGPGANGAVEPASPYTPDWGAVEQSLLRARDDEDAIAALISEDW